MSKHPYTFTHTTCQGSGVHAILHQGKRTCTPLLPSRAESPRSRPDPPVFGHVLILDQTPAEVLQRSAGEVLSLRE